MSLSRRSFLKIAGVGAALPVASTSCAPPIDPRAPLATEALADFLIDSEPQEAVDGVIAQIKGGASPRAIAGAVSLACVRSFAPELVDDALHVHYANDAALSLALDAPHREVFEPIAWAAYRYKTASLFGEAPTFAPLDALPDVDEAAATLAQACVDGDGALADAAAVRLYRSGRRAELFEILAREAGRDLAFAFHKIIHVRHLPALLDIVDDELLVRSAARSVAATPAQRDVFDENVARIADLDAGALLNGTASDDAIIGDLLAVMRTSDANAIGDAVIAALSDGASVDTIFNAVIIAGADEMTSGCFGFGRHAITGGAAYRASFNALRSDADRVLHLLQACAMASVGNPDRDPGSHLEALEPIETARVEDALAALSSTDVIETSVDASRRALGFLEGGGTLDALFEAWRQHVVRYTDADFHNVKMLHTVKREARRLPDVWRNRFVAGAFLHAPGAGAEWPRYADVRAALRA